MRIAITRKISPTIAHCELTHLARRPIDFPLARSQHEQYEKALESLGLEVYSLPERPDLPDSVFVEDTAIVLDEVAIITRPGADSRKPETETIAQALAPYRRLFSIQPPGTLDGGDVLIFGRIIYVGITSRSNESAIQQLNNILTPLDYNVVGLPVTGCLHLKSAVTRVAEDILLVNPAWIEKSRFSGKNFIEVDPGEPHAANALLVDKTILYPTAYPRTQKLLEETGNRLVQVDVSEVIKAEGGVTCCSLIFEAEPQDSR